MQGVAVDVHVRPGGAADPDGVDAHAAVGATDVRCHFDLHHWIDDATEDRPLETANL